MLYLTGVTSTRIEAALADRGDVGLLTTPDTRYSRTAVWPAWAADNGMFGHWTRQMQQGFDVEAENRALTAWLADPEGYEARRRRGGTLAEKLEAYEAWLQTFTPEQRDACLFATAPDKPFIGEHAWDEAHWAAIQWSPWLRAQGYRVAMVAQDGLEAHLHEVHWAAIDCLFIGGSTEWKLSGEAARCAAHARQHHGKWVHMGRVNSARRLEWARAIGCDSADGTFLGYGPDRNVPQLERWMDSLATLRVA